LHDLTKLPLDDFLDRLADRTPAPGGGAAAAAAGALAAALARMAIAFSVNKKTDGAARNRIEHAASRLRTADEVLRALITGDADAYAKLSHAAKQDRSSTPEQARYKRVVLDALAVPLEIVAFCHDALSVLDDLKSDTSRYMHSDLAASAILAEAAARAAALMVRVNLAELSDAAARTKIESDLEATLTKCRLRRESIEAFVRA